MKPRFARFCTAASSLLLALTCFAWALSLFRSDGVGWAGWVDEAHQRWIGIGARSYRHVLMVYFFHGNIRGVDPTAFGGGNDAEPGFYSHPREARSHAAGRQYGPLVHVGLGYQRVDLPGAPTAGWATFRFLLIPFWAHAILFAVLPIRALRSCLRSRCEARREASGLCIACGYDLRGTPQRCPECGHVARPAHPRGRMLVAILLLAVAMLSNGCIGPPDEARPSPPKAWNGPTSQPSLPSTRPINDIATEYYSSARGLTSSPPEQIVAAVR